jgi:UDP-galactose transporter B1
LQLTECHRLGIGEILLLVSLTCDGLTGAVQERMKSEHQTKSGHMMRAMNKWSILYLGIALVGSGELWDFVGFVQRHPSVVWEVVLFSVTSALGQYFIFWCVSEFGPLPCSIVTTTRKFFTVLASVVIFGNTLVTRQWLGTVLVFGGSFRRQGHGFSYRALVTMFLRHIRSLLGWLLRQIQAEASRQVGLTITES